MRQGQTAREVGDDALNATGDGHLRPRSLGQRAAGDKDPWATVVASNRRRRRRQQDGRWNASNHAGGRWREHAAGAGWRKPRKVLISSGSRLLDFSPPVASRGNAGVASGCTLPPSVSVAAGASLALGLECPLSLTQQPEILMCHPPCTGRGAHGCAGGHGLEYVRDASPGWIGGL